MPDAKGVEGPQPRPSLLRAAAARRPIRKPGESAPAPAAAGPQAPPAHSGPGRSRRTRRTSRTPGPATGGCRLDDLYRLPMPKLFALAEKRGHRRAHRHEPRPAHRRHRSPADRARRDRPRLRHARSPARRLRLPAQRRPQLPGLARKTSMSRRSQIRRMGLRTGLVVEGPIRLPIEGQDNFALMQVELVNGQPPGREDRPHQSSRT